jgi:cell wall assembly regulator SMI1
VKKVVEPGPAGEGTVKTIWDRIHFWLEANAPEVLASLRPGATRKQIRAAEKAMGVRFPEDVELVYRVHDGQQPTSKRYGVPGFIEGDEWYSLKQMVADWRLWKKLIEAGHFDEIESEPEGPIRTEWYHLGWIPLSGNDSGDSRCLDLAPAPGGRVGQIIRHIHDDPQRSVEADSLIEWFSDFADDLEDGEYVIHPDYHGLVLAEDV